MAIPKLLGNCTCLLENDIYFPPKKEILLFYVLNSEYLFLRGRDGQYGNYRCI